MIPIEGLTDSSPEAVHEVQASDGVVTRVARFVPNDPYAQNFADQWTRFRDTQLDSRNGTTISLSFLEELLGQPVTSLSGLRVLEVGSGAGRFTEHLVVHAKEVVATDLSGAIYVNAALGSPNAAFMQADILSMPKFKRGFDVVICRGVLQHTPDPLRAIACLHQLLGTHGLLVFDIYGKRGISRLRPKYLWRPLVRRLFTYDRFVAFLDRWTGKALRLRWRLKSLLPRRAWRALDYLLPFWDHRETLPLSESQLIEWSKLDTLDAMFAKYDTPMSPGEIIPFLISLGFRELSADLHKNIYRLRV